MNSSVAQYTRVAVWLHWIIAILIITNIGLAELTEDFPKDVRGLYMDNHKAIGMAILVLSIARLLWRIGHKPPPRPASMPGWQSSIATITHILFYVLMIGLPLSGWIWMSTYPAPFSFFGLFEVPLLPVEGQKALGDTLHEAHEIGGKAILFLGIFHILAALYHQFVMRDRLIARMGRL